jgi:hypothetical protein
MRLSHDVHPTFGFRAISLAILGLHSAHRPRPDPLREIALRTLIVVVEALLAVGAASPALAVPPFTVASEGAGIAVRHLPTAGAAGLTVRKKKEKKAHKKESVSFQEIGNARRGKSDLEITVRVAKTERTCELKITWENDDTTEDEADANDDKLCELSVDVPSDRSVVGDAKATVTVKNLSGKKVASASKTFAVK